jgi:transcriptional regulator with XRE-family HTH domain
MRKGDSSPIDKHVGSRVRMRRLMLDMSQTELAKALGLKFQQVRRYEKGMDRVDASRLQHLSQILKVPVAFFFEGLPDGPGTLETAAWTAELLSYVQFCARGEITPLDCPACSTDRVRSHLRHRCRGKHCEPAWRIQNFTQIRKCALLMTVQPLFLPSS